MTRQSTIHLLVVVALIIGAVVIFGRMGKRSKATGNESSPPSR